MTQHFEYNGKKLHLDIEREGDGWLVALPDGTQQRMVARRMVAQRMDDASVVITVTDDVGVERTFTAPFLLTDDGIDIFHFGRVYHLVRAASGTQHRRGNGGNGASGASGRLTSPMVGTVAEVLVKLGDHVDGGQTIASISSMKVYVAVSAPFDGTVTNIHVKVGSVVAAGAPIADVEAAIPAPVVLVKG